MVYLEYPEYPETQEFDYEAAFEQDRGLMQKQALDDLFEVWKVCFIHGPFEESLERDARVRRLAASLGLAKEWEERCECYLFEPSLSIKRNK